jgi:signal transduction histidine kinase
MLFLFAYFHQSWQKLPIRVRGTVILAIPVICFSVTVSTFAWLKASLIEDETWVQHTLNVRLETKRLLNALIDAETGVRGYGLTQRDRFLEPYERAKAVIPISLNRLENLVQDNPQQTQKIQTLRQLVNENLTILEHKLALQKELKRIDEDPNVLVPAASLYEWLEEGKATMDATRLAIERFAQTEEELLIQRQKHRDLYRRITWIVLCVSAAVGTAGALLAVYLFFQLEQELANRETNLRESNRRLQLVCEQLDRFTANASHELRTPLATVLSNAQVALMDVQDLDEPVPSLQKRVGKIISTAKQMSNLVGDLLFLARHEGLLAPEKIRQIDLKAVLENLLEDWVSQAKARSLEFTAQLPEEAVWVAADGDLLQQAIANLLKNAFHYTPSGGKVEIRLAVTDGQAIVRVTDTGCGIPAASLPHLFERFYRADSQRSQKSGGFGLGLAIAQQIVQVHGGDIGVTSQVGEGSTFYISLPLASN